VRVVCLLPARDAVADLPAYLASVGRVCDAIVALDDGSRDETREVLEASPLVRLLLANPRRRDYAGWDDGANRARLLAAAAELEPAWVLWLDADERLPADDARALRQFLAGDALPGCAYAFQHYRMWGDRHYEPRFKWIYRLFAYDPSFTLPQRRLYFNPVPTALPRIRTTIRVQHFGAATDARLSARVTKYAQADPGEANFGGLTEPPTGLLPVWRPRPPGLAVLVDPSAPPRPAQNP
jgi:glycosyltransferase involved in cell wall biosynthesis